MTSWSAAATAWLAGDRDLAGRLLVGGTGTWALSKVVKQIVRRPRPVTLLPGIRRRGQDAAAARTPPGSGTYQDTLASPSPWAPLPFPVSAQPAVSLP